MGRGSLKLKTPAFHKSRILEFLSKYRTVYLKKDFTFSKTKKKKHYRLKPLEIM